MINKEKIELNQTGDFQVIKFGSIELKVNRKETSLIEITWQYKNTSQLRYQPKTEPLLISINTKKDQSITLHYHLETPNTNLVIRQQNELIIPPKSLFNGFIYLPTSLVITHSSKNTEILHIPTEKLSKTWFGEMEVGNTAFVIRNKLSSEKTKQPNNWLTCPFIIQNNDKEILKFKRFLLNPNHLKFYSVDQELWSNHFKMIYNNINEVTRYAFSDIPKKYYNTDPILIHTNRTKVPSFAQHTFEKFKILKDHM